MSRHLQMQRIFETFNDPALSHEQIIDRIREIVGAKSTEPKVIQIEAVYDYGENGRYQPHVKVFALYDDGTVGWQPYAASATSDIPQDEPAEPDPIAELEAMGAWMAVVEDSVDEHVLAWFRDSFTQEVIGRRPLLEDIRAAAARLLARVRGGGA